MKLCKAVNEGDPLFAGNFATALQSFDANEDGALGYVAEDFFMHTCVSRARAPSAASCGRSVELQP